MSKEDNIYNITNNDELDYNDFSEFTGIYDEEETVNEISLDTLIYGCTRINASDIHLKVGEPVICRIDGKINRLKTPRLTEDDIERIMNECMSENNKVEFENNLQVDFAYSHHDGSRFRCNAFREQGYIGMAFRILKGNVPTIDELRAPIIFKKIAALNNGLVLVTGITGSGKTTTLSAIINEINNKYQKHIITLENPIEYMHISKASVIRQREVGRDVRSFGDGLKSALREDPDVILVGELRDLEEISTALTAAETGHLVLATLHTLGAAKSIDRIVDVFPTIQQQQIRIQLSGVLKSIISQKLLKREDCDGRVACYEVLVGNTAVATMIREGKWTGLDTIIQTGAKIGMVTENRSLADLVRNGIISRETAMNNTSNKDELSTLI